MEVLLRTSFVPFYTFANCLMLAGLQYAPVVGAMSLVPGHELEEEVAYAFFWTRILLD